jgi:hypothetical protein
VAKKVHSSVPPKVEYSLTASTRELDAIVKELGRWYTRWKAGTLARQGWLRNGLICNCNCIQSVSRFFLKCHDYTILPPMEGWEKQCLEMDERREVALMKVPLKG